MTFELTGAAITNAAAGDLGKPFAYAGHIVAPLVIAAPAIASWALRPENRTLSGAVPGWLRPKTGLTLFRDGRTVEEGKILPTAASASAR